MSLMRSLTTRRKQSEPDGFMAMTIGRAASQRGRRPIARGQISAPLALISTTNVLSYNAPDIAGTKPIEHRDLNSGSSASSVGESDSSAGSVHSHETDPTDMSSVGGSPISSEPETNHLSRYFKASSDHTTSPSIDASPVLPRRAPSHSKRAHEALSRKRSVQRARSPSAQGRGVSRTRSSADMFSAIPAVVEAPRENPFGKELAQLDAVVEEFGGVRSEAETEVLFLKSRGLACLAASEYLDEIDNLVVILLDDAAPSGPDFCGWF